MAELKTKQLDTSVAEFLKTIPDEQKRKDSMALLDMMKKTTKETPRIWGNGTVGFGVFHYKSEAARRVTGILPASRPGNKTLQYMLCRDLRNTVS